MSGPVIVGHIQNHIPKGAKRGVDTAIGVVPRDDEIGVAGVVGGPCDQIFPVRLNHDRPTFVIEAATIDIADDRTITGLKRRSIIHGVHRDRDAVAGLQVRVGWFEDHVQAVDAVRS
ncbi:hypothetical protein Pla100_60630 [Neorhodopirellula pilleata]|uniref:Uncharacterized protein n=1 Tax=Neorhodopirellula pilleata TaxID=2714738 RepID=A0A5C5ZH01_9BACT|nr:hypothetical protein Pla100_60630 [Neorhodopirellula pilleata]